MQSADCGSLRKQNSFGDKVFKVLKNILEQKLTYSVPKYNELFT